MATLKLRRTFIARADDLLDQIQTDAFTISEQPERDGDVRAYGSGRLAQVVGPTRRRTVDAELVLVDRQVADRLRSWLGHTLVWRDPSGRLLWVVMLDLTVQEELQVGGWPVTVSVSMQEVTGTAVV